MNTTNFKQKEAALNYAPEFAADPKEPNIAFKQQIRRLAFISGAKWQAAEVLPDLKFILEALPVEASIPDPKTRSEIGLVRAKINELIAKIN